MKFVFVALLAIVATAKSQECVPNSVFKIDCNTCHCSPDGKTAVCTLMGCHSDLVYITDNARNSRSIDVPKSEESERTCEPGTTFNYYCNTCKCTDNGESATCSLMNCDHSVWNEDGSRKTQSIDTIHQAPSLKKDCEPNKSFKYYCNTCSCTSDGYIAGCTLRYCDPAFWNRDGTIKNVDPPKSPEHHCEPGSMFSDYCNTCICTKDGKAATCTLMVCDPAVWNADGTKKVSKYFY